jgi:hypothetical protein
MKKLVYLFFACVMASFVSCGNNTSKATESADSDTVVVDTLTIDSLNADSVCEL